MTMKNKIRKENIATIIIMAVFLLLFPGNLFSQGRMQGPGLRLNNLGYFETPGVNIFVYSNQYTGMFNDEKNAGIELIHHGVRTSTGGAVRLQNTPEQWDLVPSVVSRTVDTANNKIDVVLRYQDYDFNSKISVTPKNSGVLITVWECRFQP